MGRGRGKYGKMDRGGCNGGTVRAWERVKQAGEGGGGGGGGGG